jgi:hypothetical protein
MQYRPPNCAGTGHPGGKILDRSCPTDEVLEIALADFFKTDLNMHLN